MLFRYSGMGMELAGGVLGFVALGWWIDRQLSSQPIALVVGAVFGCVGGLYHMVRRAIEMQREMDRVKREATEERRGSDQHQDGH